MSSSSSSLSLARRMIQIVTVFIVVSTRHCCHAFQTSSSPCLSLTKLRRTSPSHPSSSLLQMSAMTMSNSAGTLGNLHGQSSCFLPLLQNDEDYIAPRIVQVRVLTHHIEFAGEIHTKSQMIYYHTKNKQLDDDQRIFILC